MRVVRSYLIGEYRENKLTSSSDRIIVTPEEEAAEMQRCVELNNAWNGSIAEVRKERLEKEWKERQEYILSRLELKRERDEEALRAANELVQLEKVGFFVDYELYRQC